jgi:hypothetical protein
MQGFKGDFMVRVETGVEVERVATVVVKPAPQYMAPESASVAEGGADVRDTVLVPLVEPRSRERARRDKVADTLAARAGLLEPPVGSKGAGSAPI